MKELLKPIIIGLVAGLATLVTLWFALPFILSPYIENWLGIYFLFILATSFIVGGFNSALQMKSRYISRYLKVGAFVGFLLALLILTFFVKQTSSIDARHDFIINGIQFIIGGVLSSIGAFLGIVYENRKQKNL